MSVYLDFSGRSETVGKPLATVGVDVVDNPEQAEVIITDGLDNWTTSKPVYYRPRTNIVQFYNRRRFGRLRLIGRLLTTQFDGIIAPDTTTKRALGRYTTTHIDVIELPKKVTNWPTREHTNGITQMLTLSNFDYPEKTEPIIEYMPVMNDGVCEKLNARWVIAGDGTYSDRVKDHTRQYDRVEYVGFTDPEPYLQQSDVLLHLSTWDIQLPNAILEGMASKLPVVTTDYEPFKESGYLRDVPNESGLFETVVDLNDPEKRERIGRANAEYVAQYHNYKTIGQQYKKYL